MSLNRIVGRWLWVGVWCVAAAPVAAQQGRAVQGKLDEATYDRIVEDFIQYDIGNIRDPVAIDQIRMRFNALTTDAAVPALVRGLNRSTQMRASCPITAICSRIRSIVNHTKDPELGTLVLKNLERRDVGQYNYHLAGVFNSAEKAVLRTKGAAMAKDQFHRRVDSDQQRLASVPGMKLTDLPARGDDAQTRSANEEASDSDAKKPDADKSRAGRAPTNATAKPNPPAPAAATDLKKLSVADLVKKLDDFALQIKVLEELYRRAGSSDGREVAAHADAIIKALAEGDAAVREVSARLLGQLREEKAVPQLIGAVADSNPHVRSAAATALTRTTRQLFGPNENASADEVKQAVARWREWWAKQPHAER